MKKINSPEENWGPALSENKTGRYSDEYKERMKQRTGSNGYTISNPEEHSSSEKYARLQATFVTSNQANIPNGKEKHTVDMENGTKQNGTAQVKDGTGETGTSGQFQNPAFVKDDDK